jgi:hypothetical protein
MPKTFVGIDILPESGPDHAATWTFLGGVPFEVEGHGLLREDASAGFLSDSDDLLTF